MDQTALKTISGAIHYTLIRYNQKEISIRDWEYLCGYLNIDLTTIYNVEVYDMGFLLTTKNISLRYHHHDMHGQRVIELNETQRFAT